MRNCCFVILINGQEVPIEHAKSVHNLFWLWLTDYCVEHKDIKGYDVGLRVPSLAQHKTFFFAGNSNIK